jgi:dipeptidyl aminopeptidase/acylaminoacyl peptidase
MKTRLVRRQFGLWESPLTPISLARGLVFHDLAWDQDGTLVWHENRSDRGVLVVQAPGRQAPRDLNSDLPVGARLGYGGGSFAVGHGMVYFVESDSGCLYRQPLQHGSPQVLTPAFGKYAAPAISPGGDWLLFIHSDQGNDSLGLVDCTGKHWPIRLVSGADFYMQPAWHPDGRQIAWIEWNIPNMPWDGTTLRLGRLHFPSQGLPTLTEASTLAGGKTTAIFQPQFSPDGRYLAYVSDETGWGQLYLHELATDTRRQLTFATTEHGLPAWIQGLRTYGFGAGGSVIYAIANEQGFSRLWKLPIDGSAPEALSPGSEYTHLSQIAVSPHDRLALLASGSQTPARVISFIAGAETWVHQRATSEALQPETYSPIQPLSWTGMDKQSVHGLFFPPHNPQFESPGKPPLIVHSHGGPTSQVPARFNPQAQFFCSRGYAYLEVNYRGSTGYGRSYREALNGNWGVYDVQDAVSGARFLIDQGLVDGNRMVIMGGSAGGLTVLLALEEHPGFFKAGICLYGVANHFTLAAETHKFEARYLDTLLGPLPETAAIYRARSPVFHAEKIKDPLILFQGEDDLVVPRAQSESIVASLRQRGVPHEYHLYPGEGHGFRKTETIAHFYESVIKFLNRFVISS